MSEGSPRRGEVWLIAFDGLGSELQKTRPAVVVSNDLANSRLSRVQVVPLSSKTERIYPAEAAIMVGSALRKAMADQITTVDQSRLLRRSAVLDPRDLDSVARVIRIQLGL